MQSQLKDPDGDGEREIEREIQRDRISNMKDVLNSLEIEKMEFMKGRERKRRKKKIIKYISNNKL